MNNSISAGLSQDFSRELLPGQRSQLNLVDVSTGRKRTIFESESLLLESPNWHPSGDWIVVNVEGRLARISVDGEAFLEPIEVSGIPAPLNNDHLVSPDGSTHYLSANDWHLYEVPWRGGAARRLTADRELSRQFKHFLHGVSPDGELLAYVGTEKLGDDEWGTRSIWLLEAESGRSWLVGDGYSVADGPDFAPDGEQLFFNSEHFSSIVGDSQIFVHNLVSDALVQITDDERVNWFPHPSPDGLRLAYLSYPHGTVGHPANVDVELRLIDLTDGRMQTLVHFFGGQGSMNVSNWSPDSATLALLEYPRPAG